MLKEFKKFIDRGNVIDLAVGIIIGGAFSKIVTSLVDNIIMPLVGIIIGGINFTHLYLTIGDAKIMYGTFIQNIVDFLIVALCMFFVIKSINKFMHKREEKNVNKKSEEVLLLEEIRNLLKKKSS